MKDQLIIGSRGSKLALWQAEWVRARLATLSPRLDVRVEVVRTSGDRLPDAPLSVIGGQGAFTKEPERALLRRFGAGCRVPIAAHAVVRSDALRLEGLVASPDGMEVLRESVEGRADDPERLGEELALTLQLRGAAFLLSGDLAPVW